jgi:hypothetical protein
MISQGYIISDTRFMLSDIQGFTNMVKNDDKIELKYTKIKQS